ncbi:MAG: hypothetical protein K8F25_17055 [Fimbriimonadaceae bacterium]|nr:hypothetical protein [Alphaproteobacteria bacterium]
MATYFFVKDHVSQQTRLKLACLATFFIAALFRIEGLVFFASVLVYYGFSLAQTHTQKLVIFFFSLIALIFIPVAAAFWKAGFLEYLSIAEFEWTFSSLSSNIERLFVGELFSRVDRIRTDILPEFSLKHAWIAYIGIVIAIVIAGIVKSTTLVYGPMAIYALYNRRILPIAKLARPLIWLIFTNIILLFIFVFLSLFFDWRYGSALSLTIALIATFTLIQAYRFWWHADENSKSKAIFVPATLITLVIALAIDGLPSPTHYTHLKTAAQWIKDNTENRHAVASNSSVLLYYTGRWNRLSGPRTGYELDPKSNYWVSNSNSASREFFDFNYLAIEVRRGATDIDKIIVDRVNSRIVANFENDRGERVSIIKIIKPPDY